MTDSLRVSEKIRKSGDQNIESWIREPAPLSSSATESSLRWKEERPSRNTWHSAAHRPQLADIRGDEANQRFLVGAIQKLEDVLNTYAENLVYLEGYLGTRTTVEAKAASKGLEEATGKEFNAIIDRAGVDGYSEDLSGVFWAKGRLLKTGGRSYSQFRPETPLGPDIEIRTPKGEIILQEAWFLAMRGLVPTFEETGNGSAGGIVLTRNEEPLFIPELYLDLSKSWKGNQITRVYVWPDYQKDIL